MWTSVCLGGNPVSRGRTLNQFPGGEDVPLLRGPAHVATRDPTNVGRRCKETRSTCDRRGLCVTLVNPIEGFGGM